MKVRGNARKNAHRIENGKEKQTNKQKMKLEIETGTLKLKH